VLVVDDNATSLALLKAQLTSWKMRAFAAGDGLRALQALHEARGQGDPYRIAVIDQRMPGMDGETLGHTIRQDPSLAETPIVMLTTVGAQGDTRRLADLNLVGHITKPVNPLALREVLSVAFTDRGDAQAMSAAIAPHGVSDTRPRFEGNTARILVAEDNITNQRVALGILKLLGLSADVVGSGDEAVKAVVTVPYDLVLMDVQMPGMDGLEATRIIRGPGGALNPRVTIIAVTAHAMQRDRETCLEAGMDDYIAKPITPEALSRILDKWLTKPDTGCEVRKSATTNFPFQASNAFQTSDATAPIFVQTALLDRLKGDRKSVGAILRSFLEDIPKQIEALRKYLDARDAQAVERQAHSIQGAAAAAGGEALRNLASELEEAGKAKDLDTVSARLAELDHEFDRLREAIQDSVLLAPANDASK